MFIKETIAKLTATYGTNDPFRIAEKRNILVFHEFLGGILGYYNSSRRTQMIHLNVSLDSNIKTFVCAHELGHAILHPKLNTPFLRSNTFFSVDKVEREANTFAVELLVPDEHIYDSCNDCTTIESVAANCGVPRELMKLKSLR